MSNFTFLPEETDDKIFILHQWEGDTVAEINTLFCLYHENPLQYAKIIRSDISPLMTEKQNNFPQEVFVGEGLPKGIIIFKK